MTRSRRSRSRGGRHGTGRKSTSHNSPWAMVRQVGDVLVVILFFLLLIGSPLPMGGNRDWAWAPMVVVIGAIAVLVALGLGGRGGLSMADEERGPLLTLIFCFALMVAIALLQMSTWAPTTASAAFYARAAKVLGHAHAAVPSIAIFASFHTLLKCVACGLVFAIARAICADERRARLLLMVLLASAFLVTIYGFLELSTHSCYVGNYLKKQGDYHSETDRCLMSGTFVNSNSFGCFLGMAFVAAIALIFGEVRGRRRRAGASTEGAQPIDWVTGPRLAIIAFALLFAGGLMFSSSRAAFASTVLATLAFGGLLTRGRWRSRRQLLATLGGGAVVGIAVLIIAGSSLAQKMSTLSESATGNRFVIWRATAHAIEKSPWLGWGLGTFYDVYTVFQPPEIPMANDKAHSTPLETVLELGIPGGLIAMLLVFLPWMIAWRSAWRRRRHRYLPAAAFAVSAVAIVHSSIDFSLQMPAIGFFVSAFLGMGWAQAFASHEMSSRVFTEQPE